MRRRVKAKWRPPLMLVLGGSLLAVLILPVLGLVMVSSLAPGLSGGRALLLVAVVSLVATLVLGWLLWRLILRPVRGLAERAEVIRGGGVAEPMAHFGTPEIGDLGQTVLEMAEVLQARELAVRSYSDHVSHELKTPLTAIRGAAELLEADEALSEEAAGLVATIQRSEARLERLLEAAREIAAARNPMHHGLVTLQGVGLPETSLDVKVNGGEVVFPLSAEGLGLFWGICCKTLKAQARSPCRLRVK
ncbi:MAG: HAMP domain-containing protein [Boseongicola sp.]|nr:HAMP domain-containing protein [Boseongicola sp.]